MKNEEDEAFDELARKQGAWGGGFPAKRAMAADKLQEPEREALKLALEALEGLFGTTEQFEGGGVAVWRLGGSAQPKQAITAIKEALAKPAQEPLAWMCSAFDGEPCEQTNHDECGNPIPLYTTPPQREWVGLTAEDFSAIKFPAEMRFPAEFRAGARWADVKLKEKNT